MGTLRWVQRRGKPLLRLPLRVFRDAMAPTQSSWRSQRGLNEAPDRTRPLAAHNQDEKQLATVFFIPIDFPIPLHPN